MPNAHSPGFWQLLALPGSNALVLPLLLCAVLLLAAQSTDGKHAARRWLLAIAAASLVVIASKIAFYGWGTGIHALDLTCPSGHTVLALAFWPACLALVMPPKLRHPAIAAGVLLGLACGLSRLMTHAHPLSEVLAGCIVGGIAAAVALRGLRGQHLTLPHASATVVLVIALGMWLAIKPLNLPTERWFASTGAWLAGRDKPVQRKAWRQERAPAAQPDTGATPPQP